MRACVVGSVMWVLVLELHHVVCTLVYMCAADVFVCVCVQLLLIICVCVCLWMERGNTTPPLARYPPPPFRLAQNG